MPTTPDQPSPETPHARAGLTPLDAFGLLDLRVGRVVRVEPNEQARKPSYKMWIDFGDPPSGLGVRQSSAQLTALYSPQTLVGKQVVAAVNLGVRRIAGFESQVLVLGLPDSSGNVVLLAPEREVPLGGRVF
ncbi:MAG: tRNA-binding protein [Phycisphaeraceae bacterium]|nr:MAG: tRNA-binding protein [Phycisphaeraceae bacterium]